MPKKATTTKEIHAEAAHVIHVRAVEELETLEQRLAEIGEEASAAQAELAAIEPARQARQSQLTAARNTKERTEGEERRAQKYAQYALGTSREMASVKRLSSAQKSSLVAEKALKELEPVTLDAEQNAEKRQAELIKQLSDLAGEKASIIDEIEQARQMHEQTRRELGEQKYADIVKTDAEMHKGPIDDLKRQIVARLLERHKFLEKAQAGLEDGQWWDLSNRLDRELLHPDDDEDDEDFDGYD